eukprot:CAMPEP_0194296428 /NCGR_PEP_ID=MMETSP0169-20130528/56090_1 /TAXON_ID=218684 /ORGANISM="Corethron pennatum, Strain L29A3" /LENGTH=389 /DNA_ID=CAMNT_0039045883 /DNA_START=136 /DNA_END=1301 /DNA_ORIENTATION=+
MTRTRKAPIPCRDNPEFLDRFGLDCHLHGLSPIVCGDEMTVGTGYRMADVEEIRRHCPDSCGTCRTDAPTRTGVPSDSRTPSGRLTLSPFPSRAPEGPPSGEPSGAPSFSARPRAASDASAPILRDPRSSEARRDDSGRSGAFGRGAVPFLFVAAMMALVGRWSHARRKAGESAPVPATAEESAPPPAPVPVEDGPGAPDPSPRRPDLRKAGSAVGSRLLATMKDGTCAPDPSPHRQPPRRSRSGRSPDLRKVGSFRKIGPPAPKRSQLDLVYRIPDMTMELRKGGSFRRTGSRVRPEQTSPGKAGTKRRSESARSPQKVLPSTRLRTRPAPPTETRSENIQRAASGSSEDEEWPDLPPHHAGVPRERPDASPVDPYPSPERKMQKQVL